ncbi:hypothetical protein TSUD_300780 [Trifolium subterraneum]|uniref:Reverse transcriptase zinc-binding domain-containing protein n=1 Tax=Trifolium subterraneum TaxID=3900 RepID=A0A2Z6NHC3_TRISU|nr:hypothetical protein TSUD_300780 [Trifolium subterraneum]
MLATSPDSFPMLKGGWSGLFVPCIAPNPKDPRLRVQQRATVSIIETWNNNNWTWKLAWTAPLTETETAAATELSLLLEQVQPCRDNVDKRMWIPNMLSFYAVLQNRLNLAEIEPKTVTVAKKLWKNNVPSKVGGVPLSMKYRRLFDWSLNKHMTVAEMRGLGWDGGGATWLWRRQLWVWEDELLVECRGLLSNIVLQPHVADKWLWRHDHGGGYTVRGAYMLLTCTDIVAEDVPTDLIWHKQVPINVSVLATSKQVANERQLGETTHYTSRFSIVRNWLRGSRNGATFVSLLPGFCSSVELA